MTRGENQESQTGNVSAASAAAPGPKPASAGAGKGAEGQSVVRRLQSDLIWQWSPAASTKFSAASPPDTVTLGVIGTRDSLMIQTYSPSISELCLPFAVVSLVNDIGVLLTPKQRIAPSSPS